MPNSKDVFSWIVDQITLDEHPDEIRSIVYLLLENKFNINKSKIIAASDLPNFKQEDLQPLLERINKGEPIQYIIGTQEFYGRTFNVNSSVLIPRPETEILVSTVIDHLSISIIDSPKILDIGTGSGCIPITFQLELGTKDVTGIDISEKAIAVASGNNKLHNTQVNFLLADVLNDPLPDNHYDIIVSNPPYVTEQEKSNMKINVLDFEPHNALFVPNDDPLLFYKAIAEKSKECLHYGGIIVVEINQKFANDVEVIFMKNSFRFVETFKDLSGKDRIVKAVL
ncbi:MAG: peptide chain release factor N(5)-glutamine methyltransferase [Cyclobacteriaceae bacterium]